MTDTDIVVVASVERGQWERSRFVPPLRASLLAEIGESLYLVATDLAATKRRRISGQVRIEAVPASEADELELLDAHVQADPASWMLVRARYQTRPVAAGEGRRDG